MTGRRKLILGIAVLVLVSPLIYFTTYRAFCVAPQLNKIRALITAAPQEDQVAAARLVATLSGHLEPGLGRYPGWLLVPVGPGPHDMTLFVTKSVLRDLGLNEVPAIRWQLRLASWWVTLPAELNPDEIATLYCVYSRTGNGVRCDDLVARWQADGG